MPLHDIKSLVCLAPVVVRKISESTLPQDSTLTSSSSTKSVTEMPQSQKRQLATFSAADSRRASTRPGFFDDLFIRGGSAVVCAFPRTGIGAPADALKMYKQLKPELGVVKLTRHLYTEGKGLKGFYPGVMSYYAMSVFNAYFKNKFIDLYTELFKEAGFGVHSTILATSAATAVTEASFYMQVTDRIFAVSQATREQNTYKVVQHLWRVEGPRGFVTGMVPTMTRQTSWIFGYLELLRFGKEHLKLNSEQMIGWGMVAGALAGFLSCTSDVPKSRMQMTVPGEPRKLLRHVIQEIFKQSGIRGFWAGMSFKLMALAALGFVRPLNNLVMEKLEEWSKSDGKPDDTAPASGAPSAAEASSASPDSTSSGFTDDDADKLDAFLELMLNDGSAK